MPYTYVCPYVMPLFLQVETQSTFQQHTEKLSSGVSFIIRDLNCFLCPVLCVTPIHMGIPS